MSVFLVSCAPNNMTYEQHRHVEAYINQLVKKHHFNRAYLETLFKQAPIKPRETYKAHELHPVKRLKERRDFIPYYQYRESLISSIRIEGGVDYWKANARWLNKANQIYGVPQSIIVATIGVESFYGRWMGHYPVFNTLAILSFNHVARSLYFQRELTAFLIYCRHNHQDPLSIKGSYTGAIGQSQFMPSNIPRYGVDFNHQGKVDIVNESADAVGSVAHYFSVNHWHTGEPIVMPVSVKHQEALTQLPVNNSHAKMMIKKYMAYGVVPSHTVNKKLYAWLIRVDKNDHESQYWLAFHNFDVLKTYNNSTDYALALYELSVAVHKAYHKTLPIHHQVHQAKHKKTKVKKA